MSNKNQIKKKEDEIAVDEIIFDSEQDLQKEKAENSNAEIAGGQKEKSFGEKISLALVLVLLAVSVVQSIELAALYKQVKDGQFNSGAAANSSGGNQSLPSQQGGC